MCVSQTLEQEAVTLKLTLRFQVVKDARTMGYLLWKAANGKQNQPRRKKFFAVKKDRKRELEMQNLEFFQLFSCVALGITVK